MMKLRTDLLKELTAEDILAEAQAQQHRYQAQPAFSKTGVGYLSPASAEDSVKEAERNEELVRKLRVRIARQSDTST